MKLATMISFTFAFILLNQLKSTASAPPAMPPPATPPPPPPPPIQIWNHVLALSYGYGLKASRSRSFKSPLPQNQPNFTIHGLWPNDNPTSSCLPKPATSRKSTFCYPSSLKIAEIQSLKGRLESWWPDLYDYNNKLTYVDFWEREWVKHGTCSKFTKFKYFEETLDLYDQLKLSLIVMKSGALALDNQKNYAVTEVLQAFNMHQPFLICGPGGSMGTVLTDLYFCLDSQAKTFMNSTTFYTTTNTSCNGGFKLLAS